MAVLGYQHRKMRAEYPKMDPRLHNILCMMASDRDWMQNAFSHTRDPSPGATRQTFRCVGGTTCPMGLICNLSGSPPILPTPLLGQYKGSRKMHATNIRPSYRKMQTAVEEVPRDRAAKCVPTRQRKMRRPGRERLGPKACSFRMCAAMHAEGKGPARNSLQRI